MSVSIQDLRGELEKRTGNRFGGGELDEVVQLAERMSGCHSFVDAGANWGQYMWAANLVLSDADITAIEANPNLCSHISAQCKVIEAEKLASGNRLRAVNAAISHESGSVIFCVDRENPLNSIMGDVIGSDAQLDHLEKVEVRAVTLDELFPDNPPDFIKMDIEGAEWRGLKGSAGIISKKRTVFLIEIHPWGDAENQIRPSDVFALMRKSGYSVERLSRHWLFTPHAPSVFQSIQSRFYGFILNHPWLRKTARKVLIGR